MIIISGTGGSGSTFVSSQFKKAGWEVCIRPDAGWQKDDPQGHFRKRTWKFFMTERLGYTCKEMFDITYENLSGKNIMLMTMVWGGLGYLKDLPEQKIYLIRNPVYTYNSYIKPQHVEHLNAKSRNDKKVVDAFLGKYSHWIDHYKYAISDKKGYVVRYENFIRDWEKIPNVPPIHKKFQPSNKTLDLAESTIQYILDRTNEIS